MRVFANVLGRVKCPERRQSAGGRLPWRASREEEGQVQAPRRVRRKGLARAEAEAGCWWAGRRGCPMPVLGLSGPSRAPLAGRAEAGLAGV